MKNWITAAAVIVAGLATAAGPAAAQSGDAAKGQRVFNTQCKVLPYAWRRTAPARPAPTCTVCSAARPARRAGYDVFRRHEEFGHRLG